MTMTRIHKQPLAVVETQVLNLPKHFLVRMMEVQYGKPTLWYEFIEGMPLEPTVFNMYGTGWDIPSTCGTYIGSVQMPDGFFVWHYYCKFNY